jgi:hypothetical protein
MAIDQKWYKKSGLKLHSGDLFRILAVFFDVTITLAVVAGKQNNNDIAQSVCYFVFSFGYIVVSIILLVIKTVLICCTIHKRAKAKKKKWNYCVAILDTMMGVFAIVMGAFYLFGENLPSSLCSGDTCRQLKTGLLGTSLIINLFLTVVEKGFDWSGGWDKFKTINDRHKLWSDLLGLLSTVVLFDQALTGFYYMTVYDINVDSVGITCDSLTHGISSAAYIISIFLFYLLIVLVIWREYIIDSCKKSLQSTNDHANSGGTHGNNNSGSETSCCQRYCEFGVAMSLIIFYIFYVLADLPWPWNCKDQVNLQAGKKTRLALLIISFILVSFYLVLYFFVVFIPSAFHHTRKSVLHKSEIRSLFGARFRDMKTEVDEYCKCDRDDMKIKMQGDPKADQTTLSLPLSFQFERDTECSLWCQAYDCCSCTRQCRDVVEDRVPHTEGNNSENSFLRTLASLTEGNSYQTVPQQCASNTAESHKLNVGSVLFATPKKEATVLFIDEACNREDLMRMLSQDTSDVIIHSFSDSNEESNATPQRLETT